MSEQHQAQTPQTEIIQVGRTVSIFLQLLIIGLVAANLVKLQSAAEQMTDTDGKLSGEIVGVQLQSGTVSVERYVGESDDSLKARLLRAINVAKGAGVE